MPTYHNLEWTNAHLWLVTLFASAICLYFWADPLSHRAFIALSLALATLSSLSRWRWMLLMLSLGALVSANKHWTSQKIERIHHMVEEAYVVGNIVSLSPTESGVRAVIQSDEFGLVQMSIKFGDLNYLIGDIVSVRATLQPIWRDRLPLQHDFSKQLYFNGIGAVGYATSQVKIIKRASDWASTLAQMRQRLMLKIISAPAMWTSISAALVVGEQKTIPTSVAQDMRISGLSHILSVSGMHLTLVSVICLFCVRYLLSNFPSIAQKYDTKRIAALVALIATFAYLMVSGMQVAAVRSFAMVALVILGVLLARESDVRRAVCIAAFLILILAPDMLMFASFQMSFAAVIALTCLKDSYLFDARSRGVFGRSLFYVINSISASFVAGSATAVFAAYHFHTYSTYSLFSNLLASPIVSVLIMPAVIGALLLSWWDYGLHLCLKVMGIGNALMVKIAEFTAHLPYAQIAVPPFDPKLLCAFALGFVAFCITYTRWVRISSALVMALTVLLALRTPFPSLVIDEKRGILLICDHSEVTCCRTSKRVSDWDKSQWLSLMGARTLREVECDSGEFLHKNRKVVAQFDQLGLAHLVVEGEREWKRGDGHRVFKFERHARLT